MIVAIDFDDTLMNPHDVATGYRMGRPEKGAVLATQELVRMGHSIVIFTARNVQDPPQRKAVADWLDFFHIPYHGITNIKQPEFDVMVDNRALRFEGDWAITLHRLRGLL